MCLGPNGRKLKLLKPSAKVHLSLLKLVLSGVFVTVKTMVTQVHIGECVFFEVHLL